MRHIHIYAWARKSVSSRCCTIVSVTVGGLYGVNACCEGGVAYIGQHFVQGSTALEKLTTAHRQVKYYHNWIYKAEKESTCEGQGNPRAIWQILCEVTSSLNVTAVQCCEWHWPMVSKHNLSKCLQPDQITLVCLAQTRIVSWSSSCICRLTINDYHRVLALMAFTSKCQQF